MAKSFARKVQISVFFSLFKRVHTQLFALHGAVKRSYGITNPVVCMEVEGNKMLSIGVMTRLHPAYHTFLVKHATFARNGWSVQFRKAFLYVHSFQVVFPVLESSEVGAAVREHLHEVVVFFVLRVTICVVSI